jgi:hypothetical protein
MAKTFDYLINGGPLRYIMIYLYILRRFDTKTQRREINNYLKTYGYLPIYKTINKILDKKSETTTAETTTGGKFRKSKKTRKQKSKKTRKRKVRK